MQINDINLTAFGLEDGLLNGDEISLGRLMANKYWDDCERNERAVNVLREYGPLMDDPGPNYIPQYGNDLLDRIDELSTSLGYVTPVAQRPYRAALALLLQDIDPQRLAQKTSPRWPLTFNQTLSVLEHAVSNMYVPYHEEDVAVWIEMLRRWMPTRPDDRAPGARIGSEIWVRLLNLTGNLLFTASKAQSISLVRLGETVRWLDERLRGLVSNYETIIDEHAPLFKNAFNELKRCSEDDQRTLALIYCRDRTLPNKEFVARIYDVLEERGLAPAAARRLIELYWDLNRGSSPNPSGKWCKEVQALLTPLGMDQATETLLQLIGEALDYLVPLCPTECIGWHYPAVMLTGLLTSLGLTGRDVDVTPLLGGLRTIAMSNSASTPGSLIRGLVLRGTPASLMSILKIKRGIKHKTVQSTADNALVKVCEKLGISPDEVAEMVASDFGLDADGRRDEPAGDYTLRLQLQAGGPPTVCALDPQGVELKSIPAAIKQESAALLKELREAAKKIAQELDILRIQLEQSFLKPATLAIERFRNFYLVHPLGRHLSRRLIWLDDQGRTFLGREDEVPADSLWVRLWHPLLSDSSVTADWRRRTVMERIRQPIKQAFREVYEPNPQERELVEYSNRYAGYILDSDRYHGLRKSRNWGGEYAGYMVDDDPERVSTLTFPGGLLRVCLYWTMDVDKDVAEKLRSERHVTRAIMLQQVRFERKAASRWTLVPLDEIEPLAFSEVMRDGDLFASVAGLARRKDDGALAGVVSGRIWDGDGSGEVDLGLQPRLDIRRDLLRFLVGERGFQGVEVRERSVAVRGNKGVDYEIDLVYGNVYAMPERKPVEVKPRKGLVEDCFLPFEEEDPAIEMILAKILMLVRA